MTIQQSKPIHSGGMIERTYNEPFKKVTAATIARDLFSIESFDEQYVSHDVNVAFVVHEELLEVVIQACRSARSGALPE